MRIRAVTPELLVTELAARIAAAPPDRWVRVALDGAPAAHPDRLAADLVAPLRALGRPTLRVSAADFLRPASLRYEFGRTDPDSYYQDWLDIKGLNREVLDPLAEGGTGRVVRALWDAAADRATRTPYEVLAPGTVVLVDGALLLGQGLSFDLAVHLWLSPGALARRTPEGERWTLPAFARYDEEVGPASFADLVVRVDDPRHPAVFSPLGA
ncbi:uridine kinase [Longispora sp. NPDC051575]|uniref:uridine kinase n=1 Tax=Longispora sp. NPDC051575 TaxID=3154943 RepID=UPI00342C02DC